MDSDFLGKVKTLLADPESLERITAIARGLSAPTPAATPQPRLRLRPNRRPPVQSSRQARPQQHPNRQQPVRQPRPQELLRVRRAATRG